MKKNSPIITDLRTVENKKGNIRHVLKYGMDTFTGFGEAYFTEIKKGETKGWKSHKKMTCNIVVPVGMVVFEIMDSDSLNRREYEIGENNYKLLTIPPGYWFAFTGVQEFNLILNIADILHDPEESVNKEYI